MAQHPELKNAAPQRAAYSLAAKVAHWGFVLLFAYGIIKQVDDLAQLEDPSFLRFEIRFAALFLVLLAFRYLYMRTAQTSALPQDTQPWQRAIAKAVHLAIYGALAAIALSGLMIGGLFSLGLREGLLISAATGLHEFSVLTSYWLIALHIAAAVYHRLKKDGVWSAMVPFWQER